MRPDTISSLVFLTLLLPFVTAGVVPPHEHPPEESHKHAPVKYEKHSPDEYIFLGVCIALGLFLIGVVCRVKRYHQKEAREIRFLVKEPASAPEQEDAAAHEPRTVDRRQSAPVEPMPALRSRAPSIDSLAPPTSSKSMLRNSQTGMGDGCYSGALEARGISKHPNQPISPPENVNPVSPVQTSSVPKSSLSSNRHLSPTPATPSSTAKPLPLVAPPVSHLPTESNEVTKHPATPPSADNGPRQPAVTTAHRETNSSQALPIPSPKPASQSSI